MTYTISVTDQNFLYPGGQHVLAFFKKCVMSVGQRLLLLFKHSDKSVNAQEERLAASPQLVTRLHLSHAIVVCLHVLKIDVVILTPGMASAIAVAYPCW